MNMPGIGGLGTMPRLRATHPSLPVVLATGHVEPATLSLLGADPGTILLAKPFTREELAARIAAVLRQA